MPDRRAVLAFLVAPLVAPIGYWLGATALGVVRMMQGQISAPSPTNLVTSLFWVVVVGALPAYAAGLGAGVPLYLALRRTRWLRRAVVLPLGGALGVVTAMLMAPQLRGELFSIPLPPWAGAALGVASAEAFWRLRRGAGDDGRPPGTRASAVP